MSRSGASPAGRAERGPLRAAPQLLTYPDSLGGDIAAISALLDGPLEGLFGGVHLLPPFPSSADRGFAPLTYRDIDPRFGSWADIRTLATGRDVMLDLMVNHISRESPEFQDFVRRGRASEYADMFITLDRIWPTGDPPAGDVARIFLRKPGDPFSTITIEDTGDQERIWTTFGTQDGASGQIDLDLGSDLTRGFIADAFASFAAGGARIVRLDAIGYVVKKAGTSCFMVEPEIWEVLDWLTELGEDLDVAVLPEVHAPYAIHRKLAAHGFWTYDFVLPGLVLHAFETGDASRLARHLQDAPERQFTTLDSHDGIPVRPDLDGILSPDEMSRLADVTIAGGGNVNRLLSVADEDEVSIHQLNATYYSALGEDDDRYLAARAIQLFARGVPQVYYVGLLAGRNDLAAVNRTGSGRAVNRHDFAASEIEAALRRDVVRRILELIRLRATHPAFGGSLAVESRSSSTIRMSWSDGASQATLHVDIASGSMEVDSSPIR